MEKTNTIFSWNSFSFFSKSVLLSSVVFHLIVFPKVSGLSPDSIFGTLGIVVPGLVFGVLVGLILATIVYIFSRKPTVFWNTFSIGFLLTILSAL